MNKKIIFIKLVLASLLPLTLFGCATSNNVQIPEKSYSATNEYMELAIFEARIYIMAMVDRLALTTPHD